MSSLKKFCGNTWTTLKALNFQKSNLGWLCIKKITLCRAQPFPQSAQLAIHTALFGMAGSHCRRNTHYRNQAIDTSSPVVSKWQSIIVTSPNNGTTLLQL